MKIHALAQLALVANFAFGQQLRQGNAGVTRTTEMPPPEAAAEMVAGEVTSFAHASSSAAWSRTLKKKTTKVAKTGGGMTKGTKASKGSNFDNNITESSTAPSLAPSVAPSFAPSVSVSPSNVPSNSPTQSAAPSESV
mmetsp:Transcript_21361/g.61032  ORF Transcript_21361/g.61032 Transcript_21361/m.61032 type:complete len:138 (-) Transcript_21361:523-936(-)